MSRFRDCSLFLTLMGLLACASSGARDEPGYCAGDNYAYEDTFSKYENGATVVDVNLCVVALNEQRTFEVNLGAVSNRLLVDGSAGQSVLSFPFLSSADKVLFLNCALARADFPAVESVSEIHLPCPGSDGAPFVLGAETLQTVPSLEINGPVSLDLPALSTIDELTFFTSPGVDQLFESSNTAPLSVGYLRIESSTLDGLRINRVSDVDRLDILGSGGDLLSDGFPELRHVRTLYLAGNPNLRDCSVNQLIAGLEQPPESVVVDGIPLVPCN